VVLPVQAANVLKALKNTGINIPSKKVTVNLAPADLKKRRYLI